MKKSFSIEPGTSLIDVLGSAGYTFNYAIADLIDNSISANAKSILIYFDLDTNNPNLYILDDGDGMTLDELKQAATIANKDIDEYRKSSDLGRYSTGLKSSTRSFCNRINVSSKKRDETTNTIQIDYTHISKDKVWEAFIIDNFLLEKEIKESGTMVYCEDLKFSKDIGNKNVIYGMLDDLNSFLSHIYSKFLLDGRVKINLQVKGSIKNNIDGWDPFSIKNKSALTRVVYNEFTQLNGEKVEIKAYILPTYNKLSPEDQIYVNGRLGLLGQSGFYIYRNDRLIQEGGWLDLDGITLDDKTKYARIELKITSNLDKEFQINFSKNSIIVPSELKQILIKVAKKARNESRTGFDYVKHPELKRSLKKDEQKIWLTSKTSCGTYLSINMDHPLVMELSVKLSKVELKRLCNFLAKSLPISMIQSQEMTTVGYTENEMYDLIDAMYKKLKSEGKSNSDIKKVLFKLEPFREFKECLIEYFDKVEDDKI